MNLSLILSLLAGLGEPCAHTLDQPRPAFSAEHQRSTVALIQTTVAGLGGSADFARFLELVARRESTLQRGLVHRLPTDLDGAAAAWARLAPVYHRAGNPVAADPQLWASYGLFGMNSPLFTMVWSPTSDPRVLCDSVVDVVVYRRAAARVLARAGKTVPCKGGGSHTLAGTWTEIHGAVSGGSLCPRPQDADFRRRAARVGLDPDARVRARDLGAEPADQAGFVRATWAKWRAAWGPSS